jgi:hypothetical protein
MTEQTKELMQSTLPKGWEIVEERDFEGGTGCLYFSPLFKSWSEDDKPGRHSDIDWERGYRYARKIKVTWTADPPTEPGWYWVRWPDDGPRDYCEPTIEDVYEDLNGLYVAGVPFPDCPSALWWPTPIPAPPIQPPIEGK